MASPLVAERGTSEFPALEIVRCPITHQPLRPLSVSEIDAISRQIERGALRHDDGSQAQASCEIYRVLKPDGSAAVVYAWHSALAKLALLPARMIQAPLRIVRKFVSRKQQKDASTNRSDLGPTGFALRI